MAAAHMGKHTDSHKQRTIFANKCTDVDDGIFRHLWLTVALKVSNKY